MIVFYDSMVMQNVCQMVGQEEMQQYTRMYKEERKTTEEIDRCSERYWDISGEDTRGMTGYWMQWKHFLSGVCTSVDIGFT